MRSIGALRFGMLFLGMFQLQACVWDNMEESYPHMADCDTTFVSFSTDILPLLSNHCFTCHSKQNAPGFGGGLALEDHPDVAANSDRIIGAVNHQEGYEPMPRGRDKLDPCSISLLDAWVNSGAPDN